jgi:hypothetical protein
MSALHRSGLFILLFAVLTHGCNPLDFTTTSEVTRLRVLAIEAEPAELAFGQQVHLNPVIADPWDEGYSVQWMPCIEASIGGFIACDFENMLVDLANPLGLIALTQEELEFTVDHQTVYDLLAEADPVDRAEGVPLQFILMLLPRGKTFIDYMPEFDTGRIDDPDYLDEYSQQASDALNGVFEALIRQSRIAFKRVLVSDLDSVGIALHDEGECVDLPGLVPNERPHLGGFIARTEDGDRIGHPSGATLQVPLGDTLLLEPLWNSDDREAYYHVAWSGETECRTENPFFGWYATAGSYDDPDGFASDYSYLDANGSPLPIAWRTPREMPDTNPVDAWLVVWDRRGGMSHVQFAFEVIEATEN